MDRKSEESGKPFGPKTRYIIGREELVDIIHQAIADSTGQSHALYFTGDGGVGKTFLLEQVRGIKRNWHGTPFLWTDIIDLYHSDYHSTGGLRKAISGGLGHKYFRKSRNLHDSYEERRKSGIAAGELARLRQEIDEQFWRDYVNLADEYRLLLCFDTLELVEHENDLVQRVGHIKGMESEIKDWLLEQVTGLPNTVILFAGRPRPKLHSEFKAAFEKRGQDFRLFEIAQLTDQQATAYLDDLVGKHSRLKRLLTTEIRQRLFQVCRGRPVFLTLLTEVLLHAGPGILGELVPPVGSEDSVTDERISVWLAEHLLNLPSPFGQMIQFLLQARKGLDTNLLRYLAPPEWSNDDVKLILKRMRRLAFVKTRPGTKQIFLHDAIYDLFDTYFRGRARPDGKYHSIAEFYRRQLQSADASGMREKLMLAQMYYEFQINAKVGYGKYYAPWDDDAIRNHEIGFDMRLRDEGLRFMERYTRVGQPGSLFFDPWVASQVDRASVDRDCAVRWVDRYLARGDLTKALRVAETFYSSRDPVFDWSTVDDPIYKAGLLTAWGKAMMRSGAPEDETRLKLEQAIDLLKDTHELSDYERWSRARVLGRAHNNLGSLHMTHGRYHLAREHFLSSLRSIAEANLHDDLAETHKANLQDDLAETHSNLAYLFAIMGRVMRAEQYINLAQQEYEKTGREYRLALCRNMRGLIYTLQDYPELGANECREALKVCERLEQERGMGVVCNTLGLALRKCGDHWKMGRCAKEQAAISFQEANVNLRRALEVFTHLPEPIRLWESWNELGSLYCDWAWLTRRCQDGNTLTIRQDALKYYQQSIECQQKALDIAKDHRLVFQIADSCDDLGQVFGDRGFLLEEMEQRREAQESLEQSEKYLTMVEKEIVPERFQLRKGVGFPQTLESGVAYWLSLGKVHLWRGRWLSRDKEACLVVNSSKETQLHKALRELILAAAYFQHYWPPSFELEYVLGNLTDFLHETRISPDRARDQVRRLQEEFSIDLHVVELAIADSLGA